MACDFVFYVKDNWSWDSVNLNCFIVNCEEGRFEMFTLKASHLQRLCELNHFKIDKDSLVFMGLRGVSPLISDDNDFATSHKLIEKGVDYIYPRCTLIQWLPIENHFSVFVGSTVPHRRYVKSAMEKGGRGANQLMTGHYNDYRKGRHGVGKATGHEAFRQTKAHPIRRSGDDFDYEEDDRIEFTNPFDNIHAAWNMGLEHDNYASAGCQVISGYPHCKKLGDKPDVGPWSIFKRNAYQTSQDRFDYVLLEGSTARRLSVAGDRGLVRLRFGSQGVLVKEAQNQLKNLGYYEGRVDEDFGPRMLRAVCRLQVNEFGDASDDGIIGPATASVLGLTL